METSKFVSLLVDLRLLCWCSAMDAWSPSTGLHKLSFDGLRPHAHGMRLRERCVSKCISKSRLATRPDELFEPSSLYDDSTTFSAGRNLELGRFHHMKDSASGSP